ncbi:restriction endonuclease [Pseudomonas sp. SLFW]|uniref:restriction endonuclease n=1 Tax=Pseudomonas sp. SLFW TaxID=2683259 RepID=UPI0014136DF4|nr:restriction endonuclease [Pseudomonas sp. SLFW]NBB12529.1 restriction endonuclease [Pseudomonas sp. SLFW]
MAKKSSLFDDLFVIASKLPWWLSLSIALISGVGLHAVASSTPAAFSGDPHQFQSLVIGNVTRVATGIGQYALPFIFGCGTIASLFRRFRSRTLLKSITTPGGNTLLCISWREFELLVGEALRRRGFKVQDTGGRGPDGGIDLVARKDGETYLVQCKQWRAVQVGVPVVRELYGAMAAEGAVGGFVVTSGTFTRQARDFASGRNLQLVDGDVLRQWIAETSKPSPQPTTEIGPERAEPAAVEPMQPAAVVLEQVPEEPVATPVVPKPPACPHCRKPMVIRVARTGANAGGNFWGCGDYPKCRGIRPIFAPMKNI